MSAGQTRPNPTRKRSLSAINEHLEEDFNTLWSSAIVFKKPAKAANQLIALLVSIALIFTLSCTSSKVQPIPPTLPQEKVHGIKVGDTVKITTYSGEQYKFKVENLTQEAIEGEGHKISLVDIESIKKVRFTGEKIAAAVGIIVLLVLLVWLGSNSESSVDDRSAENAR